MARGRKPNTVLQLCVARLGVHQGALAAANAAQWALAIEDLGRMPTTVEYSDYWAVTERTGWNHRARMRDGLGDDWEAILAVMVAGIKRSRKRSPRSVMALPLPLREAV